MNSSPLPKFATTDTACALVSALGNSFAIVENPSYVHPPYDVYPLAPPRTDLTEGCAAAVMDMDGTTTTTEVLCTGALDAMCKRMCGLVDMDDRPFLNHDRDFPHIIGNSTTRHVAYLVGTYRSQFDPAAICRHFIFAAAWTLEHAMDKGRAREARQALLTLGLSDILRDGEFHCLRAYIKENRPVTDKIEALGRRCASRLHMSDTDDLTRIGIEIYYQQYHETLLAIAAGSVRPPPGQPRFIEPMPGIAETLALLKGWLGDDAHKLNDRLAAHLRESGTATEEALSAGGICLKHLGSRFAAHPAKVALVTSSIGAEATIVLGEVFRVIAADIADWPLTEARRDYLREQFSELDQVYDARITATDASEIRLKPHRDLYSLALHALGIGPDQFHRVVGFEDSESGVIAIRAAGIPVCCALPFAMTRNHHFEAATQVCPGGLPEVILLKNFFLPPP